MTPLLKKEIRLILPAWLAVLLLEVWQPWLGHDHDTALSFAPVLFFLGVILLAVDSFGREFSLGTFSALMSQPLERGRIWRTKIYVLLGAAGLVFGAYFASCEVRLQTALVDGESIWYANPALIRGDFGQAMLASLAVLFIALTGGLWTALLLRQTSAAFWVTMLAPAALAMLVLFALSQLGKATSDTVLYAVLYSAGGLYAMATFWLAHRLFLRAEDAGWTGGIISFSRWRYFEKTGVTQLSRRHARPRTALWKKELQLHSISLLGAGALLGLHLLVFLLRSFYVPDHGGTLVGDVSETFWVVWLMIPLVMGCTAVAEERKLGVVEGQFCLPVSRLRQFMLKGMVTLLFGFLLGGVMPMLLETMAMRLGLPSAAFKRQEVNPWLILTVAPGLALLGFAASTLARNFLQALSIAIVLAAAGCLAGSYFIPHLHDQNIYGQRFLAFGCLPDSLALCVLFSLPLLLVLPPWLVFRNFNYFQEGFRIWRRNFTVLLGASLLVVLTSAVVYQRPWELLQPAEPPHGLARLSLVNPPQLQLQYSVPGGLQVRLPDGRIWCDSLGYSFWNESPTALNILWTLLAHPLAASTGPQAFIGGSNWLAATTWMVQFWDPAPSDERVRVDGYLDTIGIQTNGTLWISQAAQPRIWTGGQMAPFGSDTNWQQVIRVQAAMAMLLKSDGTLWQWGTNRLDWSRWRTNWPTLRQQPLTRIGTQTNWHVLYTAAYHAYAQATDGSVWLAGVQSKDGRIELTHATNLDQIMSPAFARFDNDQMACVHPDGTLWFHDGPGDGQGTPFWYQLGQDSHWRNVSLNNQRIVALKADGTLWQWDLRTPEAVAAVRQTAPTRLGIHQDWVALASDWYGTETLAADGSLWLWPDRRLEAATWLRLPRQPARLGNIFAANPLANP